MPQGENETTERPRDSSTDDDHTQSAAAVISPDKSVNNGAKVESPPEASRESLDNPKPKKGVNWQLVGVVIGIISIVAVVLFGWLDHKSDRATTEVLEKIAENTTGIASKDPDEAAVAVARVQREPAAPAARVQREPVAPVVDRVRAEAVQLEQQGKFEEAIEKWRAIANIVGEEDRQLQILAWFAIGYLHSEGERADLEASLDAYTRAIELNPALAETYNNRGGVKEALGRHDEAIADYTRAIELNPVHAGAYYNRGNAKNSLRQYDEAIADYDQAIKLNPSDARAYNNRGNAKNSLRQYDEAIADYTRTIELNPAHAGAYNNRGIVKEALGRRDEAIADYNHAIELNPALAEAYYNRGNAKREAGRTNEAREDYRKAFDLAQETGDENIVTRAKRRLSRLIGQLTPDRVSWMLRSMPSPTYCS